MSRDWYAWHDDYDRPGSALARRLTEVRRHLRDALDRAPTGPLRAVSLCAGQGRDLIPVLATHPRRDDVTARLVELNSPADRAGVGVHRFLREPRPLPAGERMFEFVDRG
ncbi:hypothetical protein ABZ814_02540 [Micromonospora musae]|uniref:hypothetical protein n=1 Tax=Micromonospora musae TaxID=1894970 RepID=UPI0033BFEFBA